MGYNRTFWVDQGVDQNGNVIQHGTLQDQDHFNNMEVGIFDNNNLIAEMLRIMFLNDKRTEALEGRSSTNEEDIAAQIKKEAEDIAKLTKQEDEDDHNARQTSAELLRAILFHDTEVDGLKGEVVKKTLKNTQIYPFNNSLASVQLSGPKVNKDYTVDIEADNVTGGAVGDIFVRDKLVNGFKIEYTGSAKSVDVTLHIRGGI
ncbi:MAG: hypothetical protein LKG48_04870 [Lachnospiraceae bacterium]|jgi:hypothetical protein|nr:hypothetical protein [Lachnospiraceae bacterium]MCH4104258.1 hypothetical protein [Lachnospiraceae bacterium]MCI1309080.1 hypothetical protein [Lachnospiraceae bacterium]MCI1357007.1 hypothetical protein [Lachnospiraceae bacterium]MCI1357075.1 hypothetical protein [Lachnospiraceae bacterium]